MKRETRREIRYFATANACRCLVLVPIAWGLAKAPHAGLTIVLYGLIAFHLACIFIEVYKGALTKLAPVNPGPQGNEDTLNETNAVVLAGWHAPWPGETERHYERFGFRKIRTLTNHFVTWAGGEPPPPIIGLRGRNQFIRQTVASETIHLVGGVLSLPFLVHFWRGGWFGFCTYVATLIVFDGGLALLQRYHRIRAVRSRRKAYA